MILKISQAVNSLHIEIMTSSAPELFLAAARGLMSHLFGDSAGGVPSAHKPRLWEMLRVTGATQEDLLSNWISQLLERSVANNFCFSELHVISLGELELFVDVGIVELPLKREARNLKCTQVQLVPQGNEISATIRLSR